MFVSAAALDDGSDFVVLKSCHSHSGKDHIVDDTAYRKPSNAFGCPCGSGFTLVVCEETEGVKTVCDHKVCPHIDLSNSKGHPKIDKKAMFEHVK